MSSDLDNYIKENAKFLRVGDGESIVLIYKGYSVVDDRFNPGKKVVSYLFQYTDSDKTIPWNKSSSKVAVQMAKFAPGDKLKISRLGEGPASTYSISKVA